MRIAFREKPYDLLAVVVLGLTLIPFVAIEATGPVRIVLGLFFVLFLPGYALIAALFPGSKDIDWIERVALSLGLSIAVVPLLGLLLNYTPWGIRLESIITTVLMFTVGMCAVAYYRRMRLPVEERLSIALNIPPSAWKEYAPLDKALTIGLVASVILAAGVFAYVMIVPREGEKFTEFYILDKNGTAANYPTRLNASEQGTVIIGIVNHEFSTINYTVNVVLTTVLYVYNTSSGRNDTVEIANVTLDSQSAVLGSGLTWEQPFNFSIVQPGNYKLRFLLFTDPQHTEPYRSLHLWIKVT
jgi:uncharacterized membrane protein